MGIKTMRVMDLYEADRFGKPLRFAQRHERWHGEEMIQSRDQLYSELIRTKEEEIQMLKSELKRSATLLAEMRKIIEDAGLVPARKEAAT